MQKTKIIFLVLPDVQLLDLAGPDQVFLEAIGQGADITVEYCSVVHSITTSSQLAISKLKLFHKVSVGAGDYVFIPGTDMKFLTAASIPLEAPLKKWLTDAYQNGAYICSVCTGAFLLARLGLLAGRKCTTHWKRTAELASRYPAAHVLNDILFTEDERILTSAGVTAGIDLALHITATLQDDRFSFHVARELVVYNRRQGNETQHSVFMQYRNHIHSGVHKVQDYLQEHIDKKPTLVKLGDMAFMSSRNLTRVFKKETGITINEYVTLVRKEYLQKLVADPDITRKQLAVLCGLKSERQVIRLLNSMQASA